MDVEMMKSSQTKILKVLQRIEFKQQYNLIKVKKYHYLQNAQNASLLISLLKFRQNA